IEGIDHAARLEADRLARGGVPRRPAWSWLDTNPVGRAIAFSMARRAALKQSKGRYPAPLAAIDAIRFGLKHGMASGLANEGRLVGERLVGAVPRTLVGFFLASRASQPPGAPAVDAPTRPIGRLGVLGAGTMGGGIAAVTALTAGLPVRLKDVD